MKLILLIMSQQAKLLGLKMLRRGKQHTDCRLLLSH